MTTPRELTADQRQVIDYLLDGEDALLCADVGTGKTVMALTAMQTAIREKTVRRWLVLAPKLVAENTWKHECAFWPHLSTLQVAIACGTAQERHAAIFSKARVVVMNYENVPWLFDEVCPRTKGKMDPLPFDGIVYDELDKLKQVSSSRFKALRWRLKVFKKRIGMTGTVLPTHLSDIWGQTYMVDGGETFGRSFYKWRKDFFYPTDFKALRWAPREGVQAQLTAALAGLALRVRQDASIPIVEYLPPAVIEPAPLWQAEYRRFKRTKVYELANNALAGAGAAPAVRPADQARGFVVADSEAILIGKLQQLTAGFLYKGTGKQRETAYLDRGKVDWLVQLLGDYPGDQWLIVYHYQAELDALERVLGARSSFRAIKSGLSSTRVNRMIDEWNAGATREMAIHAQSAGHGLNLQHNGAHRIAFLTLPWSGGLLKQVIGRLARKGNRSPIVYVHTCVYRDTVDRHVFDTVTERAQHTEEFADAIYTVGADH